MLGSEVTMSISTDKGITKQFEALPCAIQSKIIEISGN